MPGSELVPANCPDHGSHPPEPESGNREFPPRLPFQPSFHPVLNEEYAAQIARDWNTKDEASGHVGYVTRFRVRAEFLNRYCIQTVGGSQHQEYWIPAEELPDLNRNLVGLIEVIAGGGR